MITLRINKICSKQCRFRSQLLCKSCMLISFLSLDFIHLRKKSKCKQTNSKPNLQSHLQLCHVLNGISKWNAILAIIILVMDSTYTQSSICTQCCQKKTQFYFQKSLFLFIAQNNNNRQLFCTMVKADRFELRQPFKVWWMNVTWM